MRSQRHAMILWDLENWLFFPMRPLRNEAQEAFALRVHNDVERYLELHGIKIPHGCKHAFARDDLVDLAAARAVAEKKGYTLHVTDRHIQDAADELLVEVGCSLLEDHRFPKHVVLLTGDTDFMDFTRALREDDYKVWVIMPGKEENSKRQSVCAYKQAADSVLSLADVRAYLHGVQALNSA